MPAHLQIPWIPLGTWDDPEDRQDTRFRARSSGRARSAAWAPRRRWLAGV